MESLLTLLVVIMVFGMLMIKATHRQMLPETRTRPAAPRTIRPATVAYPKDSKHPTRAYHALLAKQREAESCGNFDAALLSAERALQHIPGMLAENDEAAAKADFPSIEATCLYWGAKQNRAGLQKLDALLKEVPALGERYAATLKKAHADAALSENILPALRLHSGLTDAEIADNLGASISAVTRITSALVQLDVLISTEQQDVRRYYLPESPVRASAQPLFAQTA